MMQFDSARLYTEFNAKPIWLRSGGGTRPDEHVLFRRRLKLGDIPSAAPVAITAATEYRLYVNGVLAGFGPPISDHRFIYLDRIDLSPLLRRGQNVLACHVYSLAEPTEHYHGGPGFLWVQSLSHELPVDTPLQWRTHPAGLWSDAAPRRSFQLGFVEFCDLRKEEVGWHSPDFDDHDWQLAASMGAFDELGFEAAVTRRLEQIPETPLSSAPTYGHEGRDNPGAWAATKGASNTPPKPSVVRVGEVRRRSEYELPSRQMDAEDLEPLSACWMDFGERGQHHGPRRHERPLSPAGPGGHADGAAARHAGSGEQTAVARVGFTQPNRDAVIVVDCGRMEIGVPYVRMDGRAGTLVDVATAEYLRDGRVIADRRITPSENTSLADRLILREGEQEWQRTEYGGFRYIQLTLRAPADEVTARSKTASETTDTATETTSTAVTLDILDIGVKRQMYPFRSASGFRTADPMLDRILAVSDWSHRISTYWGYVGSTWREHAQWVDLNWMDSTAYAFASHEQLEYYLEQITLCQDETCGRMGSPYPGTQQIELPEQSMWLIDGLALMLDFFGDRDIVRRLVPRFADLRRWFASHHGPNGLLEITTEWKGLWLVLDWGYPYATQTDSSYVPGVDEVTGYKPHGAARDVGELASVNMIYYGFLATLARLARAVDHTEIAVTAQSEADRLREAILEHYFDEDLHAFVEIPRSYTPIPANAGQQASGHRSTTASPYANTLALFYGIVPSKARADVLAAAVDDTGRTAQASPWFSYTTLVALARAGRYDLALTMMRTHWGGMLRKGATCFWEQWDYLAPDINPLPGYTPEMYAQSISYAGGPLPFSIRYILGLREESPGCRDIELAPYLGDLTTGELQAPIPAGPVRLQWIVRWDHRMEEYHLELPTGVQCRCRLPLPGKSGTAGNPPERICVNGREVSFVRETDRHSDTLQRLAFTLAGGSVFYIRVEYA